MNKKKRRDAVAKEEIVRGATLMATAAVKGAVQILIVILVMR